MAGEADERWLVSPSVEATEALGEALGRRLPPDSVVALDGDLGTGKTALVRGIARGLGITEAIASPTYVLMQAHEGGRLPLYHFDAWMEGREKALFLEGGDHWLGAGGVAVVEWAARVEEHLPAERLAIELRHRTPHERTLRMHVPEAAGSRLRTVVEAVLEELAGVLHPLTSGEPSRRRQPPNQKQSPTGG